MTEIKTLEAYKQKLAYTEAMAQIETMEKEFHSSQGYVKTYLWSVLIPPIGIYYFIKYVFFADGTEENVRAGVIALVLTLASLFLSIWLTYVLFKQTTSGMPPQNLQIIKDLAAPENQKKLFQLYK